MQLLSWMWRPWRRREKKVVAVQPALYVQVKSSFEAEKDQPVVKTIVFIDIQNAREPASSQDWDVLRTRIAQDCKGEIVHAGAYRRVNVNTNENAHFLVRAKETWKDKGYVFKSAPDKDIDHVIITDMAYYVSELMEKNSKVELRLILVSGDGDFAPFIENARKTYQKRLDLKLFVYSWRKSLNRYFITLAGAKNIRYLDDIDGFLKAVSVGK